MELQHVLQYFKPVNLKKGESVLKEGDVCNNMWFVVSGCMMLVTNSNQQDKIIELFSKNYFFVELISFVNDIPAEFHLKAVTETKLLSISKKDYKALDNYCESWRSFRLCLYEKVSQYMTMEIINLKTRTNEERYNKLLEKRPFLFQLIPQYIIANYLDMTPVGLSKLRGRLTGNNNHVA